MNAADALQTFAEISVGVTGFSAVVVAISPNVIVRDDRRLHWGLSVLFTWALAALFFSALPFILFYLGVAEPIIWRSGLLVMGGYFAIAGANIMSGDRRLNRLGLNLIGTQKKGPLKTSPAMVFAGTTYAMTSGSLLAAGVWFPMPGVYLLGMAIMLALSLWVLMFFYFLSGLLAAKHRKSQPPSSPSSS
jgi:hypothetical protein